ncbi:NUDIX domain-containing protein [Streptomyces sp. NBC_00433]
MRPTVAAAVILHGRHVLLIRRRVPEGSLSWQFPAGGIKPGETAADAVVRETLEEAGVLAAAIVPLGERVHPGTRQPMAYVACQYLDGTAYEAAPAEVAEVAWARIPDLGRYIPLGDIFGPARTYLLACSYPGQTDDREVSPCAP